MSLAHRRWVSLGLLGLFALVALSPLASAQGGPQFTIAGKGSANPITQDRGATIVYYNVTISAAQQNQFTQQFDVEVTVNVTAPSQNGWSVGTLDPPTAQRGKAGGPPLVFKLVVENTQSDPDGSKITMTFTAHARPIFTGGGAPPNPVAEQLLEAMSQESDAKPVPVTVTRNLDLSERITGLAKANPWLLLAAAGVLVVMGVVVVKNKKKGGLSVRCDSPMQEVLPGRGASYPVQLRGEGTKKQSITLGTSQVPPGWSAILPVDRVELGGNEATTIWLTLKAPQNAISGQHVQVNFVATGSEGMSAETLLEAMVVERYGQPGGSPPMDADAPLDAPMQAPRRARG